MLKIKKTVLVFFLIPLLALALSGTAEASNTHLNQTQSTGLNGNSTLTLPNEGTSSTIPSQNLSYQIGYPVLTDIWVDPVKGNDQNSGNNTSKALRTLNEAWNRIPQSKVLQTTGYRIMLMPGDYSQDILPANGWMESRYGSYHCPIIIQSVKNGVNLVTNDIINFYDCRYIYLIGLNLRSNANNVLHLEKCDHILLRNLNIRGLGNINDYSAPQEDLKVNQCQYIYLEDSDISNAWNVPVDLVAVENGHIIGNRIHQAGDWCIYLKGGSAHFIVSGNEIYQAENGGFTAGQGTGFEWMLPPYIHYEVYDIKFFNNIIHDTHGAGMGVNGGYNILLAYNTLYRVGDRSHGLEFTHGIRSCDGNIIKCQSYLNMGGWGTSVPGEEQRIPNKNVYVYNNILYNPDGYQSAWSHFAVAEPFNPAAGSNIPSPSRSDDNLQIKGNIIWNGPPNLPLGIEDINTSLNPDQLRNQNEINTLRPQLINPEQGNFRPTPQGNVWNAITYPIPDFSGNDLPAKPTVQAGNLSNLIDSDYEHMHREQTSPPGSFAGSSVINTPPTVVSTNPSSNSTGVSTTQDINIYFSENIIAGAQYSGIYIKNLFSGNNTLLTKTISGNTLIIKQNNPRYTNTLYQVYIPAGAVKDTSLNSLTTAYTFQFKTLSASTDNTPPVVISTNPTNNATGFSLTSPITIIFSENIYPGVNFSGIYVKNLITGKTVSIASKTISGNKLIIKQKTNRLSKNQYQIYLPAGAVKDASGNNLAISYFYSFKTI